MNEGGIDNSGTLTNTGGIGGTEWILNNFASLNNEGTISGDFNELGSEVSNFGLITNQASSICC